MSDYIDIVLTECPGPESSFVEVEDGNGASISIGEWICDEQNYWRLRIPDPRKLARLEAALATVTAERQQAMESIVRIAERRDELDRQLTQIRAALEVEALAKVIWKQLRTEFIRARNLQDKRDGRTWSKYEQENCERTARAVRQAVGLE